MTYPHRWIFSRKKSIVSAQTHRYPKDELDLYYQMVVNDKHFWLSSFLSFIQIVRFFWLPLQPRKESLGRKTNEFNVACIKKLNAYIWECLGWCACICWYKNGYTRIPTWMGSPNPSKLLRCRHSLNQIINNWIKRHFIDSIDPISKRRPPTMWCCISSHASHGSGSHRPPRIL